MSDLIDVILLLYKELQDKSIYQYLKLVYSM